MTAANPYSQSTPFVLLVIRMGADHRAGSELCVANPTPMRRPANFGPCAGCGAGVNRAEDEARE